MEEFLESIIPYSAEVMGAAGLLVASFTSIISVVNPLAAMPVFLSLTEKNTPAERNRTAKKSATYMFLVLGTFLLAGTYILSFFGISLPAIGVAGGLIIMRSGFSMLNPETGGRKITDEEQESAMHKEDVSFSPLAMPLLSGPGSIAVVIGLGVQAQGTVDLIINGVAIFLACLLAFTILRVSPWMVRYIGQSGMSVMTRMMGFITLCIGVQFIINGILRFFDLG
ncbi:MAG: MarC family NAAT transporter [Bacteroidota bacterium]